MKFAKFLMGAAMYTSCAFLWTSCKKTDAPSTDPISNEANVKLGGFVEDGAVSDAKVPLIISSSYLAGVKDATVSGMDVSSARGSGKPGGDRTVPSVSISSPTSNSTVTGNVTIQVNASDNIAVSLVSVSVDGVALGNSSSAPYNFNWNTSGVASGTHTITATAKDAAGNSKTSSVQVGVNSAPSGDLTAPSVSFTSPGNGSAFTSGASVSVTVNASDNIAVSTVKFSVDGVQKNSSTSAPYNFSWNTTGVANGTHTLTATASDAAGNISTSNISVTVNTVVLPPATLPSSVSLIAPPVGHQGSEGACVAFSTTYARAIEQYYRTHATSYSYSVNVFSPEYVYNQAKIGDCNSGTSMGRALELMKTKGVCTWETMPYSGNDGCSAMPSGTQDAQAANFKIGGYSQIEKTDITAIKTMIASNHPVIINVTADNSFMNAGPGFIWSSNSGSGALPHSILICGYDDSKNAYKVMNSWGTTWGEGGFGWIDYDFFPQVAGYYLYVMNY